MQQPCVLAQLLSRKDVGSAESYFSKNKLFWQHVKHHKADSSVKSAKLPFQTAVSMQKPWRNTQVFVFFAHSDPIL